MKTSHPFAPEHSAARAQGTGSTWKRYAAIYGALFRNSVIRDMQFKANFVLWIIVELLWFALQLVFIQVIYAHTDEIATWTKWEVILLVGASHLIQEIFHAVFVNNITQLSEHIRTGRLDFMMLVPMSLRFLISCRTVDLGSLVNAIGSVAVMVYACYQLALIPSIATLAGVASMVVLGVFIHYGLMFALGCVSFWTIRAEGLVWGYYNLFFVARFPDRAFPRFFRMFFSFVIPVLLVANVPVKFMVDRLSSPGDIVVLGCMTLACLAFSQRVWRTAISRYTSASS